MLKISTLTERGQLMESNLIAVIEVSPAVVSMAVFQRKGNLIEKLEDVSEMLLLFDYTDFNKISFKKIEKLCDVLNNMKGLARSYGIQNVWAATTSSFSELENMFFLIDLVELKTGLRLYVPTVLEKKRFSFKNFLLENRSTKLHAESDRSLIVTIGAKTTDISLLDGDRMLAHEIFNTGNLKMADILDEEKVNLKNASIFVRDSLENYLRVMKKKFDIGEIDKLFFLGDFSLDFLGEVHSEKISTTLTLSQEKFLKKFDELKEESFLTLSSDYGVSEKIFKRMTASALLIKEFSDFFNSKNIYYIEPDAKRTFSYLRFFKTVSRKLDKKIDLYSLECAKKVGDRYLYDEAHSEFLLLNCQKLFNKLKPVHKFSNRQLHLLNMAGIFHDTGKFVSFRDHHKHSYYLVKETAIFGLDENELQIVANLCYYHNVESPNLNTKIFRKFSSSEKITILKLTAILKLLVSLDRSKRQKFGDVSYSIDGSNLIVEVSTDEDLSIEKWSFNSRNKFFKEVFGLKPVLKVKRRYLEDVF